MVNEGCYHLLMNLIPDAYDLHFQEVVADSDPNYIQKGLFLGEGQDWSAWAWIKKYPSGTTVVEIMIHEDDHTVVPIKTKKLEKKCDLSQYQLMYPFWVFADPKVDMAYSMIKLKAFVKYCFMEAAIAKDLFHGPIPPTHMHLLQSLEVIEAEYNKLGGVEKVPDIYRPRAFKGRSNPVADSVPGPPESGHPTPEKVHPPPGPVLEDSDSLCGPPQFVEGPPHSVEGPPHSVEGPPHSVVGSPDSLYDSPDSPRRPLPSLVIPSDSVPGLSDPVTSQRNQHVAVGSHQPPGGSPSFVATSRQSKVPRPASEVYHRIRRRSISASLTEMSLHNGETEDRETPVPFPGQPIGTKRKAEGGFTLEEAKYLLRRHRELRRKITAAQQSLAILESKEAETRARLVNGAKSLTKAEHLQLAMDT
ncbi:hypothetical protein P154DRAFT_106370 [Amniculicola lignicola CBS 123094]|uniref:Uncharacterized protein n=1 Tax=Amniculicola lignicola CBS 123094 TaxID=1392246 RepID=A0A6A5W5W1_9PLEO|nr:hypothetical protein P154DRAFT_106370 [Amniculicola lignicola CBS 123094]